jgi:hypothetical protein
MAAILAVLVALIGGFMQSSRHPDRLAVDVHMVWWMGVVGVASVLGAGYLIFDGAQSAEWIGYTQGDGGFQWETAMGDLAIGVLGIMAYPFRGHFWLATIVVLTIRYVGDAAGHIYYSVLNNNPEPSNVGILLCVDILVPIIMWALYATSWRNNGDAVPKGVARPARVTAHPDNFRPDVQS